MSSNSTPPPMPESIEDKIQYCLSLKEEGNHLFRAQQYTQAIRKYKTIALYLTGLDGGPYAQFTPASQRTHTSTNDKEHIKQLLMTADLNLAQCYLKLSKPNYEKAKEYATKVLSIDANNVKALVRRAQAHTGLNDIENARVDLHKLEALDANSLNDPIVKQLNQRLQMMDEEQTERQRKVYSAMFK